MIMVVTGIPLNGPLQGDRLRLQGIVVGAERVEETLVRVVGALRPKRQPWSRSLAQVFIGQSPYLTWHRHQWTAGNIDQVPDILCAFQLRMAPVALSLPASYRILDLTDSMGLYRHSLAAAPETWRKRLWLRGIEKDEVQWGNQFDEVWVSSSRDQRWLAERGLKTLVIENTVLQRTLLEPGDPRHLLFVGNLEYLPNRVGLQQFLNTVWPQLERAGYRLTVLGKGSETLHVPGVHSYGYVPDLLAHYQNAGVVISPVPMGAGSQNKILEAMGWGRPIVAHRAAMAGLSVPQQDMVIPVTEPHEWLSALRMLENPEEYRERAKKGLEAVSLLGDPVATRLKVLCNSKANGR